MQSNNWENFYQSGRVSDYLKYIDSARNAAEGDGGYSLSLIHISEPTRLL